METLQIRYETGAMVLYLDNFFPCTIDKARKIFPLINLYCSSKDKEALKEYLSSRAAAYKDHIAECERRASGYPNNTVGQRRYLAESRKTEVLLKRMNRNMSMLKEA